MARCCTGGRPPRRRRCAARRPRRRRPAPAACGRPWPGRPSAPRARSRACRSWAEVKSSVSLEQRRRPRRAAGSAGGPLGHGHCLPSSRASGGAARLGAAGRGADGRARRSGRRAARGGARRAGSRGGRRAATAGWPHPAPCSCVVPLGRPGAAGRAAGRAARAVAALSRKTRDREQHDGAAGRGVGVERGRDPAHADEHADRARRRGSPSGSCRASSWAAALGTIIRALISSRPTTRIDDDDRDGGEHRERDVERGAPACPVARAYSSSLATANSRGRSAQVVTTTTTASAAKTHEVAAAGRGDGAEEVGREVGRRAAGRLADDDDAGGDAAVEQHRQRDVAAGAAAGADQLDERPRPRRRRPARSSTGRGAGEHADRHAGQGDVAHAVADEGQPALDEEDADHRGGEADEQRGEQGPLHEVVGEQLGTAAPPARSSGPAAGVRRGRWSGAVLGSWWWLSWCVVRRRSCSRAKSRRRAVEGHAARRRRRTMRVTTSLQRGRARG